MKKLILGLLPVLTFALAACGGDDDKKGSSGGNPSNPSTPVDPDPDPDPDPDVPTPEGNSDWYIVGEGSFSDPDANWSPDGGVNMAINEDDNTEVYTIIAMKSGDKFKFVKPTESSDPSAWWWVGTWHVKNEGAVADGAFTYVAGGEGIKDVDIVCNTDGVYTFYLKPGSVGSTPNNAAYIGVYEAPETAA